MSEEMKACKHGEWIHHFESVAPMYAVSYFTCKDCGYDTRNPDKLKLPVVDNGMVAIKRELMWEKCFDCGEAVKCPKNPQELRDLINNIFDRIYSTFGVPAGREVSEKKLEEIYDKAIMDADMYCGDGNATPYEKKYTIVKAIKTALESGGI